jgi:hypothetical protein
VADQDQESTHGLSETMIYSLIEITNSATANNTLVADQYQGSTQGLSETINNTQMEKTSSGQDILEEGLRLYVPWMTRTLLMAQGQDPIQMCRDVTEPSTCVTLCHARVLRPPGGGALARFKRRFEVKKNMHPPSKCSFLYLGRPQKKKITKKMKFSGLC